MGQRIENGYQYDAFGGIRNRKEEVHNRILYTGQQHDQVTGQYYLRARYYNPVVGRFLQEDVYRGDGLNLYAYCANNPVVYYDPSGYAKNKTNGSCDKKDGFETNENDENLPGRSGALNEAKRDAGVPRSQQPDSVNKVEMRTAEYEGGRVIKDSNGNIVMTTEYTYTNTSGNQIVIQDHSAGHEKGGQGPHFNVRPKDNTRTGKVEGTKDHYPFKK